MAWRSRPLQSGFKPWPAGPNLESESCGGGFNNFQNYTDNLKRTLLDGCAYHLNYNGSDVNNPDSYNAKLNPLKVIYNRLESF